MKKIFIIGNWKMNPQTLAGAERLLSIVDKGIKNLKYLKNIEIVICPPFVYLESKSQGVKESRIKMGAQDCHWEESGAYTGEVSAVMLKSLGCKYVIIGHSERRKYSGETNEMINKKLLTALRARLKPVLCVGGNKGEDTDLVVRAQLVEGLKGISKVQMRDIIIVYEPVWAIGTGDFCKPNDVMKAGLFIRKILTDFYDRKLAEEIPVIYGGSVNSKNAKSYIAEARMDGLLPGGASLDPTEFIGIVKRTVENV